MDQFEVINCFDDVGIEDEGDVLGVVSFDIGEEYFDFVLEDVEEWYFDGGEGIYGEC